MKLYNTLTRKKQEFKPLKPDFVRMYVCGPTVYGPGHLGHTRTYTNFDLLRRALLYNDYQVKYVMNITDVHDDMIKAANKEGITIFQLANRYIPLFMADLKDLNILPADVYPRVTEHIPEIIKMAQILIDKGFAYGEKDGSVYYQVLRFKDYGKLSGIKPKQAKTGTRVETDKYEKREVGDFALWKGAKKGEPFWQSPWGEGRPGWHIECSVMAKKHLGLTLDIHGGAMDLKFPHHENEIAQSEAANGEKFVNFWVHAGLLEAEGQKMSKSLGNFIEIHQIKKRGFDPLALRYLFLTAHYRQKMNFTWKGLEGAQKVLDRLRELLLDPDRELGNTESLKKEWQEKFLAAINDDLNMPQALAVVWEMIKDKRYKIKDKRELILDWDRVLGLRLARFTVHSPRFTVNKEVKDLIEEREKLRKEGRWAEADRIRKKMESRGWRVEDTKKGPKVKKIRSIKPK